MREMIKYRYALDEHQKIIDVVNVKPSERKDYICLSCERILRPVLGEIRRRHFRHQDDPECSGETYLHKLGKLVFKQEYQACLDKGEPFVIELSQKLLCNKCQFNGPCEAGYTTYAYDLTRHFRTIHEEIKDNIFVPDLLLLGPNDKKIYIEIAVSHFSSDNKIASGIPLIEFQITNEDDLDEIRSCRVSEASGISFFYNFKLGPKQGDYHKDCLRKKSCFVLWKTGKAFIGVEPIYKIDSLMSSNAVSVAKEMNRPDHSEFIKALEKAHTDGHLVTNCYLCRYHAGANNFYSYEDGPEKKGPIFCKFLKKRCQSNYAAECQYYKIDEKVFGTERYEERKWYQRNKYGGG